jgi:DNA repair protein REV1
VDSYKAVSSRDEKVVYGGGGLQESSSYPTPPELKNMDLDVIEDDERQVHLPPHPETPPANATAGVTTSTIPKATTDVTTPTKLATEAPVAAETAAAHNLAILRNPSLRSSTVLNPDFLKSYFDQSRLHHLSTWKADLKNQMQQLTSSQKPRRTRTGARCIMHVDFDCFFCSVSLLSRPELKDKPVVVGHGGAKSGEIASCNYVAREFGVHNGMSMGRGFELCKDLVCLPYDFPGYERASRAFYEILLSVNADAIQAVSVDEALLDVSSLEADALATSIRDRVREKTQCEVSIGIGGNILQAKLALRKAKPCGQYHLQAQDVQEFLQNVEVRDLPGVGWKLSEKLEEMNISTVGDVRTKSLGELKTKLGPKTGEKLYGFARGIDNTEVGEIVERKSVSVEVNVVPSVSV